MLSGQGNWKLHRTDLSFAKMQRDFLDVHPRGVKFRTDDDRSSNEPAAQSNFGLWSKRKRQFFRKLWLVWFRNANFCSVLFLSRRDYPSGGGGISAGGKREEEIFEIFFRV